MLLTYFLELKLATFVLQNKRKTFHLIYTFIKKGEIIFFEQKHVFFLIGIIVLFNIF